MRDDRLAARIIESAIRIATAIAMLPKLRRKRRKEEEQ